mmetsp:Transcript_19677/g.39138  ORF Transcript_19677/g.39138 Transcript_19677/m.39138 type:complete len:233 (-) Transcript_19677:205-903(-)
MVENGGDGPVPTAPRMHVRGIGRPRLSRAREPRREDGTSSLGRCGRTTSRRKWGRIAPPPSPPESVGGSTPSRQYGVGEDRPKERSDAVTRHPSWTLDHRRARRRNASARSQAGEPPSCGAAKPRERRASTSPCARSGSVDLEPVALKLPTPSSSTPASADASRAPDPVASQARRWRSAPEFSHRDIRARGAIPLGSVGKKRFSGGPSMHSAPSSTPPSTGEREGHTAPKTA